MLCANLYFHNSLKMLLILKLTLAWVPGGDIHAQEAKGDDSISSLSFEGLPAGIQLGVGGSIGLQGDADITGDLTLGGGIQFPDGSIQTTAAPNVGASANYGLYDNRIVEAVFSAAFTEVCMKNGSVSSDIHSANESTAGGNCLPGDTGWIIERDQRTASTWEDARMECLLNGMRLPEVFEFLYTCKRDTTFGLSDMTDDYEWAANTVESKTFSGIGSLGISSAGGNNCLLGSVLLAARSDGNTPDSASFRCVR